MWVQGKGEISTLLTMVARVVGRMVLGAILLRTLLSTCGSGDQRTWMNEGEGVSFRIQGEPATMHLRSAALFLWWIEARVVVVSGRAARAKRIDFNKGDSVMPSKVASAGEDTLRRTGLGSCLRGPR